MSLHRRKMKVLKKDKSAEDSLPCGTQSPLHEYQEKVGARLQLGERNPA